MGNRFKELAWSLTGRFASHEAIIKTKEDELVRAQEELIIPRAREEELIKAQVEEAIAWGEVAGCCSIQS